MFELETLSSPGETPSVQSKLRKKATTSTMKPARKRRLVHREIARRAYAIFLARGGADGHDVEDWLQAEAELAGKRDQ